MPSRIDQVIDRIKATCPGLSARVEGAAALAALMRSNALPQVTPAAHVVPLGLTAGRAETATGAYRQDIESLVGVLITLRTAGRTGGEALPDLDDLLQDVIGALAGWGPTEAMGVFRLARGQLVTMAAGTLVYQLDFALPDQLRIAR